MKLMFDRARRTLGAFVLGLVPAVSVAYIPVDWHECIKLPLAEVQYELGSGHTADVAEALLASCKGDYGSTSVLVEVLGPETTPTREAPHPDMSGKCWRPATSGSNPNCPNNGEICAGGDGSRTWLTDAMLVPLCGGQDIGRNSCGAGQNTPPNPPDNYWRCPSPTVVFQPEPDPMHPVFTLTGADPSGNGAGSCPNFGAGFGSSPGPGIDLKPQGNPINPALGEKTQTEADFGGSADGLEFVRFYRSSMPAAEFVERTPQDIGRYWRHSWFRRVDVEHYSHTQRTYIEGQVQYVYVYRPDGRTHRYSRDCGAWVAPTGLKDTLVDRIGAGGAHEGWRFVEHHSGLVETYSAVGDLEQIQQRNGRKLVFTRDVNGAWVTVTSDNGRTLRMNYTNGRITSVVNGAGESVQYTYDAAGNLSTALDPDGKQKTYHYNEAAYTSNSNLPYAMTGITDEAGVRYAIYKYNSMRRAISSEHVGGVDRFTLSYTAGANSVQATVTDPLGSVRQYDAVAISGVLRYAGQSQPAGAGCGVSADNVSHDTGGNVLSRTDFNGYTTCYAYDTTRRLETTRIEGVVGTQCPSTPTVNTIERKISTEWHPTLSLAKRRASPSRITTFVYNGQPDPAGGTASCASGGLFNGQAIAVLCKRIEQATTDANGASGFAATTTGPQRIVTWTYDAQGRVLTSNGARIDVDDTTTYTYRTQDASTCASAPTTCPYRVGDLWKTTNALNQVFEIMSYDGAGRVLSMKDPNNVISDMEYTARGWLSRRLERGTNNSSETDDAITVFTYEPYGAIKKVTQPDGSYLNYHYDAAHRLTGISDVSGERIDYTLDLAGNRTKEEVKASGGTVKRLLARQYDALSRMRSQINAPYAGMSNLDDAAVKKTSFEYDANGNNTLTTDALGTATPNTYDALSRLIQSIGDQGTGRINANSQFGYDAMDNLRTVTDPKGLVTTYTYDGLGNQTQLSSPDTGITNYVVDTAGNRTQQTDARGVVTNYTYDKLNRLTAIAYPSDTSLNIGFVFDAAGSSCTTGESFAIGRLSSMTDASGSTDYCYDRFGRMVRKVQLNDGIEETTRYAFNSAGRLTRLTYPSGSFVDYGRDTRGRITSVSVTPSGGSATTVISAASYLPFGPISQLTYGNGRVQTRAYDSNYWVDVISGNAADSLLLDAVTNNVGNIIQFETAGASNVFGYDALGRLNTVSEDYVVQRGQGAQSKSIAKTPSASFSYDLTGNRTIKRSYQSFESYEEYYSYPSNNHRLGNITNSSNAANFERTYDAIGNHKSTRVVGYPVTRVWTYDARNRMVDFRTGSLAKDIVSQYQYNGRGERVRKYTEEVMQGRYGYDEAGHLLVEQTATDKGENLSEIIWLDDLPVGLLRDNVLHYIEPDHLGTPRQVIDPASNTAVWRWNLLNDPFGESTPDQDPDGDTTEFVFNMRFPGQLFDSESGLHYNYFRDYEPGTGRYVESDPIGLDGGTGTYVYASNSPLSHIDPYGESSIAIDAPWVKPVRPPFPIPAWAGPVAGVGLAGLGGWQLGGAIYPHISGGLGSAIDSVCAIDANLCFDRWQEEVGRCAAWKNLGSRWVRACKDRARNRFVLCTQNGGEPDPDEPPEWSPFKDYPQR